MNLNRLRKLAGLTESWDEDDSDDGMSASERALAAKADKDLAKKGIKVGHVDPEKDIASVAKHSKSEDDDEKPAAKKAVAKSAPAKKAAPKKEEKKSTPAPAKKRGRPQVETSKTGGARGWMNANKNASRKEFIAHATGKLGMSAAHASTIYYALKRKVNEAWYIQHPRLSSYVLAENTMQNMFQWVNPADDTQLDPVVYTKLVDAEKALKFIRDHKNFGGEIKKVVVL